MFSGQVAFQNEFYLSIKFTCNLSQDNWILKNVYGPCTDRNPVFIDWFNNIDMPDDMDWIVLGDFNLMSLKKIKASGKWEGCSWKNDG